MSLEEFVGSGLAAELDNGQVRFLAGEDARAIPVGECTPELLEMAKKNVMEHFSILGEMERFDESIDLMRKQLSWELLPLYKKVNVDKSKKYKKSELPQNIVTLIKEKNALDCALYEWNAELLTQQFANNDSTLFTTANDIFQKSEALKARLVDEPKDSEEASKCISIAKQRINAIELRAKLQQSRKQLKKCRQEKSDLKRQLKRVEREYSNIESELESMKTSKFWKMRSAWLQLKKALGMSRA
jgi:hypothetical protein